MNLTAAEPPVTLADFLRARALTSTPHRLALDIGLGAAAAACAFWARPLGWVALLCAGWAFVAYGIWAVAERQLQPGVGHRGEFAEFLWYFVRTAAAITGLAAFALCLFALLGLMIGNWIH
jgi:hypothetical protein